MAKSDDKEKGPHYVVLLGDLGTGKSTIVEKLTGKSGRSSIDSMSCTKTSEPFHVPDHPLIVSDTPGSNSRKDRLEHNVWIAGALNFKPVSRIFIVVKAEPRIDSVIDNVQKYTDYFLDLPMDVVGVFVTHMDVERNWNEEQLTSFMQNDLGIKSIVFSSKCTTGSVLSQNILKTCNKKYNLTVDGENFLKLFKTMNKRHQKVMELTKDELNNFRKIKEAFDQKRIAYENKDQVDLVFEFQAYMKTEIVEAEKRLSKACNFDFLGENRANEAGHVANLANQLREILYDIRIECLTYQNDQTVSEFRKCPHCNEVWAKVEGCDGDTTCGNRPTENKNDLRAKEYSVLGTYSFCWFDPKLDIVKSGEKRAKSLDERGGMSAGCGKTINWTQMAPAKIPLEFKETTQISTMDVPVLPPQASDYQKEVSQMINSAKEKMKLS